ncbi:MAG TPA: hypothetical protein VM841_12300 [Actinomycetota bacterium]|nr:hypothetical protein [Actinomycetota bacterium]
MRSKGVRFLAAGAAVAALAAAPARAGEDATVWHELRSARAIASWGAVSLDVAAYAGDGVHIVQGTPEAVSFATVCVKVRDRARRRFEHGCGSVPLTFDAITGTASIRGSVPTNVLVLNQYKILALSSITVRAELGGAEAWRPGPVFVPALSDGRLMAPVSGVWRPARATISFRSAVLGAYFSRTTAQSSIGRSAAVVAG